VKSTTNAYAVYNTDGKIVRVWRDKSLATIDARGLGLEKDGVGYHEIMLVYLEGAWWPCFQSKPIGRKQLNWENADPEQEELAKALMKLNEDELIILGVKNAG